MSIHICPVEISAALMMIQDGLPYIRYSLCTHAQKIKDKIYNERKKCEVVAKTESERQKTNTCMEHPACTSEEPSKSHILG